jgi:hypothetical protein
MAPHKRINIPIPIIIIIPLTVQPGLLYINEEVTNYMKAG